MQAVFDFQYDTIEFTLHGYLYTFSVVDFQ